MKLPTWLYSKDGFAEIVRDQATYDKRWSEGWRDSPARFAEEAAEKAQVKEPTPVPQKKQSPKVPAKKAVHSADDLI